MPLSATLSTKKTKTRTLLLCDKLDDCVAESESLIARFSEIKNDLEYDPDLVKKAMEHNLIAEEDLKEAMQDTEDWKNMLKSDIKAAVMLEKRHQKSIRKERRKNLGLPEPTKTKTGIKRRGSFL